MALNYWLFILVALACLIDIKTKNIPDLLTIGGMAIGLLCGLLTHNIFNSILGISAGILAVHLLQTLRILKLGGGDAKLFGMLGAFLGWRAILTIVILSAILSIPHKLYRLIKNRQGTYPYSPFIGIAALLVMIYAG